MNDSAQAIRVMLVDDQMLVRGGLKMLVDSQSDLQVIAEAADGAEAVSLYRALVDANQAPDVVLMDVRMPVMDGLQAARTILALDISPVRVLMLTTFDLDEYVYDAVRAGASGFLLKDAPPTELLGAIRTVHRGDAVIAPSATRRLLQHMVAQTSLPAQVPASGPKPHAQLLEQLTPREMDIYMLLAQGLSNGEMSEELVLSEATIKTHVSHILGKLGARDRVQAVIMAYEAGLVS
ncbi:MAG: response regulator transcription factor [Rothia sp. (in: high G+C Gram-positive bacteria)]|uniref:response regulator n=1 Tax=Rothia sp. (in: high G+C Gram-positive bacteria) TaxID=1885016 RepID=UPI0026DF40C2|nr:response regulator transcription factor [Rothia sp. (in: high G+C Gram-positive bacteria)]MDO5750994.1 response regulator transcription factor [Rothia sp. (in: high G+C Gram-positive bacteria)]